MNSPLFGLVQDGCDRTTVNGCSMIDCGSRAIRVILHLFSYYGETLHMLERLRDSSEKGGRRGWGRTSLRGSPGLRRWVRPPQDDGGPSLPMLRSRRWPSTRRSPFGRSCWWVAPSEQPNRSAREAPTRGRRQSCVKSYGQSYVVGLA